ncbi:unnamed protein product [Pleuronectes platessa]|uniref:small monomeric GTPase n=1 Tax=Pleuronectes platessa TaxID=8262 RepID=A0A9N7Y6L4_PLEPL|nr:unnamed protein product [Pleuronectes platessa]
MREESLVQNLSNLTVVVFVRVLDAVDSSQIEIYKDGLGNSNLRAEGVFGPKLRLHVQDPHHRKQQPFVSTVGIDFKVKTIYRNDKRIKLQIWDTAGQERYRTITTAYYRGAMGFILMYDITNEESFNAVQDWSTQIKTYSWDNAQVLLVGNKCDMEDERVVGGDRGRQLSEHLGFEFFEASAKDNINVKQTFERLVDIICEKMSESLDAGDPAVTGAKQGPQLTEQPAPPHQDCAC